MNFNDSIRNECEITEKPRGVLTELLISQLQIALENQTSYQK